MTSHQNWTRSSIQEIYIYTQSALLITEKKRKNYDQRRLPSHSTFNLNDLKSKRESKCQQKEVQH